MLLVRGEGGELPYGDLSHLTDPLKLNWTLNHVEEAIREEGYEKSGGHRKGRREHWDVEAKQEEWKVEGNKNFPQISVIRASAALEPALLYVAEASISWLEISCCREVTGRLKGQKQEDEGENAARQERGGWMRKEEWSTRDEGGRGEERSTLLLGKVLKGLTPEPSGSHTLSHLCSPSFSCCCRHLMIFCLRFY